MDKCYACGLEIEERDVPPGMWGSGASLPLNVSRIGKYTLRRSTFDENWKHSTEDIYYHESCWFHGFAMAIKHGWLTYEQSEAYKHLQSARSDSGVDHS